MKHIITAILGVVCVVFFAGERLAARQASVPVLPIFVDYEAPPQELAEFANAVDAVAIVHIQSIRFENPVDPTLGRARDVTKYAARVVDTLKAHPMLPADQGILEITRLGGQHLENGQIVRSAVRGFEEFQQNGEYVLFLTWNGRTSAFDIAFGPSGSYQLLPSGRVRSLGQAEIAAKQHDKSKGIFLAELRTAIAR